MLVKIANPIYDSVFKGLMQDTEAAKTLISSILEMKVIDLEFKPQEYQSEWEWFSVYRIDFKAKVALEEGKELIVLVELQKIKFHNQSFRFRRYIGNQYANKDNMKGNEAIPIITIYILGHHLQVHEDIPIIRVKRQYLIHGTEEVLKEKEPFIEGITHDAIVIQLPAIKKKKGKKTELEKVLSVFDVAMVRMVEFDESEFPVSYYSILRRLMYLSSDIETQKQMEIEDEVIEELRIREQSYGELQEQLEEEKKRAEEERKRAEEERNKIKLIIENLRKSHFDDTQIEAMLQIKIKDYE